MEMKLKPCPFCGGEAVLIDAENGRPMAIECDSCWAVMTDGLGEGIEALIDAWNTRE